MPTPISEKNQLNRAYIVTGPTSGYGLATAQEVASTERSSSSDAIARSFVL